MEVVEEVPNEIESPIEKIEVENEPVPKNNGVLDSTSQLQISNEEPANEVAEEIVKIDESVNEVSEEIVKNAEPEEVVVEDSKDVPEDPKDVPEDPKDVPEEPIATEEIPTDELTKECISPEEVIKENASLEEEVIEQDVSSEEVNEQNVSLEENEKNTEELAIEVVTEEIVAEEPVNTETVKEETMGADQPVELVPSSAPQKKDTSVLECIASDWCFSDGEQEETEEREEKPSTPVEIRTVSPKPVASPINPNRSSAEIIAMDWEDSPAQTTESKDEKLIVTVSDKDGKPVEENVLILHDLNLSELNIAETDGITIISVDENPRVQEKEQSVVIHEIEVIKPADPVKEPVFEKKYLKKRDSHFAYKICSKEEIHEAISSCTKVHDIESLDPPVKYDIVLKTNILKRLASKILPEENEKGSKEPKTPEKKKVSDKELLDILEGDSADLDVYNLDSSNAAKSEDQPDTSPNTSAPKRNRMKPMDPLIEREIALRQLSEIPEKPESMYRKARKGKTSIVVNVPSTCIIKSDKSAEGVDPFNFVENVKTEGTPSKYGPGISSIKTYNRKSIDKAEPGIKEIMQTIPKEILDLEKEHNARKQMKKSPPKVKTEVKSVKKKTPEPIKKKIPEKKPEKTPEEGLIISKSSRIIKKKIIWDPSLEFPTYVSPKVTNKAQKPKDSKVSKKTSKPTDNDVKKEEPKDEIPDEEDEFESFEDEESNDSGSDYEPSAKTKPKLKTSPKKPPKPEETDNISEISTNSKKSEKVIKKKEPIEEDDDEEEDSDDDNSEKSSGKRKSDSHALKKKKKIKLSEVDKLLMDEGAINMLYSVENDEKVPLIREKQKVISMDKFDKEMVKKKRMIMSALTTTPEVAPKALRKKESPTATQQRKKSRESNQDPLQSPPPSPSAMFPPRAEASRIIRRHSSSSSFSSECMSPRRLSVVDQNSESTKSKKVQKSNGDAIEFWDDVSNNISEGSKAEGPEERLHTKKMKEPVESRSLRKRPDLPSPPPKKIKTNSKEESNEKPTKGKNELETGNSETPKSRKETAHEEMPILENYPSNDNYKEITLRKTESLVHLTLTPQSSKIKNTLNIQTMKEICDALTTLRKDSTCKVVLLTSTGKVFCRGLDYAPLIQTNAEKRKTIATETANAISEFIRAIVNFPKPLIAGVNGTTSGLGVSILPLCDLVFVTDNSTFSMNHCKLGCLPEGAACVTLPHVANHNLTSQLLYMGLTIKDGWEAQGLNLASVVIKQKCFFEELISVCKDIAAKSSQSMESIKAVQFEALRTKVAAALDSESHLLVQHWTSAECQQLFKKALEQNSW